MIYTQKVVELNIEYNNPTVSSAIQKLKDSLTTYKRKGTKAVIVIHGYGSTGTGGSIKTAVRSSLSENSIIGIVRCFTGGENWLENRKSFLSICGSLDKYESRIADNNGVTVVILR